MASVRASASGVTLQIGLLSVTGSLFQTTKSQSAASRLTSVCPDCAKNGEMVKVNQVHACPTGHHGPFAQKDLMKAVGSAKNLTLLGTAEEVREAQRVEGPGRVCNLVPYPAEEVREASFVSGSAWIFNPDVPSPAISLLLATVGSDGSVATEIGDVVLLGEIQIRETAPAKLVSIITRNGQVVMTEMARPELVTSVETAPVPEVQEALKDQFAQVLATTVADFDAAEHKSTVAERFTDFITSKLGSETLVLHEAEPKQESEMDLEEQLKAMLANAGG